MNSFDNKIFWDECRNKIENVDVSKQCELQNLEEISEDALAKTAYMWSLHKGVIFTPEDVIIMLALLN